MTAPLSTRERRLALASLPAADQIRTIKGERQERSFAFERASADAEKRTVWMSIASEAPYDRWWGVEILEVTRKAMRTERLDGGAPILVDHSTRDQVGVIDDWEIGPDRKLRVLARFSKSVRAEEVWQDVLDGIRKNTSVGYWIHELLLVKQDDDVNTYRVTDWEPLEGSLVAVPADPSVGPGRALDMSPQIESSAMSKDATQDTGADASADALANNFKDGSDAARADERKRIAVRNRDIIAIGAKWPEYGGPELAMKAIGTAEMTVDVFRDTMLKVLGEKHRPLDTGRTNPSEESHRDNPAGGVAWGMGARDMLHAANIKSFKGVGKFLKMEDHEAAYRAGMWARVAILGDAAAARWCQDAGVLLHRGMFDGAEVKGQNVDMRALGEGVFGSAGWLVPPEMSTAMILNREQYGIARRICRMWPMSSATLQIPRWRSGTTAYFTGEGTEVTSSDPAGDQVTLSLKDLMATTRIGKSTAMDSAIPLAEFVADEQARARAIKEDGILISGDGTSTYGGMQGCKTLLDTAAYAGGKGAATSGHDKFEEVDISDVAKLMAKLPVFARAGARFVCSGVFETLVFGRLKMSAGGNTNQTLTGKVIESDYGGFPISIAHDMPAGADTAYNGVTICLFGNFQLGVAFGSAEQMLMTVDPYSRAKHNQTEITTVERIDIIAHGVEKSTTVAGPVVALHGTT